MLSVRSDPAEMFGNLADRGWTDGLPVLPPTEAAVRAMIAASGLKGFSLGVFPPLNGNATVEKLAANAVMAGCLPEYFPAGARGGACDAATGIQSRRRADDDRQCRAAGDCQRTLSR